MDRPTPTLLLVGPTAVGKTAALDALAAHSTIPRLEIISADSRHVYQTMNIGTAKPSVQEQARARYHLIDVISPRESWDVGQFVEAADALIPQVRSGGAAPVICGGTAFYHQGYIFGLPGTPRVEPDLRRRLEERLHREGLEALRRELREVDPASDQRIAANDRYRVLRALEVYHTSGHPLSSYGVPSTPRSGIAPVVVGLYRPREELYRRIAERVERMFEEGLPGEVSSLLERGYLPNDPGLQTIGYREFLQVGGPPPWSAAVLEQVRDRIARNTRRYAKRQETFFRRLPGVQWIHADDEQRLRLTCLPVLDT
ncbi:MAG TPA: tRNA (adenosine(37)-N6)-dimethylallyltransferase MiaA [Alkalispirochaeta sp.]|nr:tRNA (adenosine(37)-N6)-dimethylallyltransferase MiaA [Alkalispirochaeta sp.]